MVSDLMIQRSTQRRLTRVAPDSRRRNRERLLIERMSLGELQASYDRENRETSRSEAHICL
jgi:hypothetical protein